MSYPAALAPDVTEDDANLRALDAECADLEEYPGTTLRARGRRRPQGACARKIADAAIRIQAIRDELSSADLEEVGAMICGLSD